MDEKTELFLNNKGAIEKHVVDVLKKIDVSSFLFVLGRYFEAEAIEKMSDSEKRITILMTLLHLRSQELNVKLNEDGLDQATIIKYVNELYFIAQEANFCMEYAKILKCQLPN
jgi:hypothetical protein